MHIAIIGTGSIGSRHLINIKSLKPETTFTFIREKGYTDQLSDEYNADIKTSIKDGDFYDAVIIATPSSKHMESLRVVIRNNLSCFIEKPVVTSLEDCQSILSLMEENNYTAVSMVGCNLRYLPSLQTIKESVCRGDIGKIVRVTLEAGKWLPDWRPSQDYKTSYSALKSLGGGVILDLIHEIDIARWIFGEYTTYKSFSGHISDLSIETEDVACILLSKENGPIISINLDYVSRQGVRQYRIVGTKGTIEWDLWKQLATMSTPIGTKYLCHDSQDFNVSETYVTAMSEFLNALSEGKQTSQNLHEGLKTTKLALEIKERTCK